MSKETARMWPAADGARRRWLQQIAAAGAGIALPSLFAWPEAARADAASRPRYRLLHEFRETDDPAVAGGRPNSLMQASDGLLYGCCSWSGPNGGGTVFRVREDAGVETVHAFSDDFGAGQQGDNPQGRLVEYAPGLLLGTTLEGGDEGVGTVFRLGLDGAFERVYSFDRDNDGAAPNGGLLLAADGWFYGYTQYGGRHNGGVLYRVDAEGRFEKLFDFLRYGTSPVRPSGSLMQAADGSIYGCTLEGGANGRGAIYRLAPDGSTGVAHSFSGRDGALPDCRMLQTPDGSLYGNTRYGGNQNGGVIFRIAPDGRQSVLHRFDKRSATGGHGFGGFLLGSDGALYGQTSGNWGGLTGSVYRMTLSGGRIDVLHNFGAATFPVDLVEAPPGALVGVTYGGGSFIRGTLFRILDAKHPPA